MAAAPAERPVVMYRSMSAIAQFVKIGAIGTESAPWGRKNLSLAANLFRDIFFLFV